MFSVALQTDGCAECGTRLPALHNKFQFEISEVRDRDKVLLQ